MLMPVALAMTSRIDLMVVLLKLKISGAREAGLSIGSVAARTRSRISWIGGLGRDAPAIASATSIPSVVSRLVTKCVSAALAAALTKRPAAGAIEIRDVHGLGADPPDMIPAVAIGALQAVDRMAVGVDERDDLRL